MHLFKAETGYSIGSYISEKRLLLAKNTDSERNEQHGSMLRMRFLRIIPLFQGV